MTAETSPNDPVRNLPWRVRVGAIVSVLALLTMLACAWGFFYYYPEQIGPSQPIPFSHRVHATDKKISCVFCHPGAIDGQRSGIPPLQTCMLCHERIIVEYPQIRILREHYDTKTPVEWVRINDLPDFAHFNHQVHLRKGFDCGRCHGDVAHMDRVQLVNKFEMGFCITCHKEQGVSHDCFTCHR